MFHKSFILTYLSSFNVYVTWLMTYVTPLCKQTVNFLIRHSSVIWICTVCVQGSQSRGQHDGVHGFPEPVKSFITFVILSQISCGNVQKPSHFFCTRLCQSFSWVCCSFQDYLEQLKKKRKILLDWVNTSVCRGNLENCGEPRGNV